MSSCASTDHKPHLVAHGEAADHDGDGQGDDEHAAQRTQPTYKLAHEGPEVNVNVIIIIIIIVTVTVIVMSNRYRGC